MATKKTNKAGKDSAPTSTNTFGANTTNKKANYPTMLPAEQSAFGAWDNNKKIVGTWGKAEDKNAWLNISGMGFKKIRNTNAQTLLALLLLGAHARDKNRNVNVRTEADNQVYELYVW